MPAPRLARFDAMSVLSILDAAYDVEPDDRTWLANVCEKVRPLIEEDGAGVHAFCCDLGAEPGQRLTNPLLRGGDAHWTRGWKKAWWERFMLSLDDQSLQTLMSLAPVSHATDLYIAARARVPTLRELLQREELFHQNQPQFDRRFAYPDSLNLVAIDPSGRGLALVANRRTAAQGPPHRRQRAVLGSLCAHLASAARLRTRVRAADTLLDGSDAILDGRGKLVHLAPGKDGEAARRLVEDVAPQRKAMRQRSPGRETEPEETLTLWRALYAGHYSVLDVFSRDGKRYVVARKNQPGRPVTPTTPLSERELQVLALWSRGHGNTQIAYELGLSPSTVAGRLASSSQKLAVRDERDLMTEARKLLAPRAERRR